MKLYTENIQKTYKGRQVVKGVTVEVNQGEIVGLLGPNGAGKTTSFYMIVGLVKPDQGSVFLDDLDIITIINQKGKLSKLESQRKLLAEDLKETKNTLRKLKNINYLESYARSQKFFKKDDEDIFVITYEEKRKK